MRRALVLVVLAGCAGADGPDLGPGAAGSSCSFTPDGSGAVLVSCQDGSLAVVHRGPRGLHGVDQPEGQPAADGGLTRMEFAPTSVPGCVQIFTGLDRNGGGFLDGDEISDDAILCRPGPRCGDVYGDVTLAGPLRLASFTSAGCTSIRGKLTLSALGQTTTLLRLEHLGSVGALAVRDNPFLRAVDLPIQGPLDSLVIERNDSLTSVAPLLGHVSSVAGPFTIVDNPHLSNCEAVRLYETIGPENVQGPVTISGNGDAPCSPR